MPDDKGLWHPIWTRGGRINEIAWIGKDVLAWCSALNIVFYEVTEKRESLRWSPSPKNNDGACCLSGHPTLRVLAFAEKTLVNAKIRVLSYPTMIQISNCSRGTKTGYLATAFTSTDNFISLSNQPNYCLSVWVWRTGERIASINTSIRDPEYQLIRVTRGRTNLIGQLGRSSGKLQIWEVNRAGKTVILDNHDVTLPDKAVAHHIDWTPESVEPILAIVDKFGHVYLSNEHGTVVRRIVMSQRCDTCPDYEAPSVCWFRDGIILRTTFCQIRFFKRNDKDFWQKQWYVKSDVKPRMLNVHSLKKDRLFYQTQEGYLTELDVVDGQNGPRIEKIMYQGGFYNFVDIVRPWGHHVVAMDDSTRVNVLDCYDGKQVGQLDLELEGEVTQLSSHPYYPVVTVITKTGRLAFLTLRTPEDPRVTAKFYLQRDRLDLIKYSQNGKYLVVGQRTTGICYLIVLTGMKAPNVIARVETKCRMADVLLYDIDERVKLVVLVVSSRRVPVGRHLVVYDLESGQNGHVEPTFHLELPRAYQFLHYAPEGHCHVIATVYLSRQIHLLTIDDWKRVNLTEAIASDHRLRRARLFTDCRFITSAALDGSVTLRNGKTRKLVATMMTHHRTSLGVAKTMIQPSGNIVVALGHDGSLVGMKFRTEDNSTNPNELVNNCRINFDDYEKLKADISLDYTTLNDDTLVALSKVIDESNPGQDGPEKTWDEQNREARLVEETEKFSEQKMAVLTDFVGLRRKVVKLLNDNELCPDIERLPVSAFDLDKFAFDQKSKAARDDREDAQHELEHNCASMDKVAHWIKHFFYDSVKIHEKSLLPIVGNDEITNFNESIETATVEDALSLSRIYWDSDRPSMDEEPVWQSKLYGPSKSEISLTNQPRFDVANEKKRINELLEADDDDDDRGIDEDEIADQLAKKGTTTHRYVDVSNDYNSQFERQNFSHLIRYHETMIEDCRKLRDCFNRSFDDIHEAKKREMSRLTEFNQRIRHINEELELIRGRSIGSTPIVAEWNCREIPERIVTVSNEEVKVKPYVTSSQRELSRRREEEAENLRRALLADDFRERALSTMMDGVLEIRWEDVVKRDIPKPICMIVKNPEDYNTDDILAVRRWENEVEALNQERERYRRLLESEFARIVSSIRDNVEKFDGKFRELKVTRMKMESAIEQLILRDLRGWLGHMVRVRAMREDDDTRRKIVENEKMLKKLDDEYNLLRDYARDCRIQYDDLAMRDKTMEKKFRNDFTSLRKIFVEILEREYKRRPRIGLKMATASDYVELGKNAIAKGEKCCWLTHECSEYLRHLEILDARPIGLPDAIEDHHWDHLTRTRRHKIDSEMRLKARSTEINETERTIVEHNEKIERFKINVNSLNEKLLKMKRDRIDHDRDIEIQLILKLGQIEIKPRGNRDDAQNALLIPREEICAVNETIVDAGAQKLTSMSRTVNFRRGIIHEEWEHQCRKSSINDLNDDLVTLENVSVTREIRNCLDKRFDDFKDEKSNRQLERELEIVRINCAKRLEKWSKRLRDVDDKIVRTKRENEVTDAKIVEMNVERWDLEWRRDVEGEAKLKEYRDRTIVVLAERSKIVRKLQKIYNEVLIKQTEHELARLRTFPCLNSFETLNDDTIKK